MRMKNNWLKKAVVPFAAAALLSGTLPMNASASFLNLNTSNPDFFSEFITVSYDQSKSEFLATGFATGYTAPDGSFTPLSGPEFKIDAFFDTTTNTFTKGTLQIGSLLSGDLKAAGFDATDPHMEFLFSNLGGTYQPAYGNLAFVNLGNSGFNTSGWADGDWTYSAVSDTWGVVPEPGTVSLLLVGAGTLLVLRKRSSAK